MNWRDVWKHQLRWARTIRVCQPVPYFFSILSNATLWPLLWLLASPVLSKSLGALLAALALLLVRIVIAQNLQRRFMQSHDNLAPPWLVPVTTSVRPSQSGRWERYSAARFRSR